MSYWLRVQCIYARQIAAYHNQILRAKNRSRNMNSTKDNQGDNLFVIYSEEIEAVTISKKNNKLRVYCRPGGFFEFRFKRRALVTNNHLRFEESVTD